MMKGLRSFWRRITDGMALSQLWNQFHTDARTSYRLYSQEIDSRRMPGTGRIRHFFRMVRLFLWAIIDKLSPARRVLLLIALILFFPSMHLTGFSTSGIFWGCILLFVVLLLEIADRVVMKRDGTIVSAVIMEEARSKSDAVYRDIALSARNAVILSSPIALPPNDLPATMHFTLDLDPKDAQR